MAKKQMAFFFDSSGCSGCKACQMACKDRSDQGIGVRWRRVYEIVGGGWKRKGKAWIPEVMAYNLSIACNHCSSPVCRDVCPTGAIRKRKDGIVLIDTGRCMGCRYCSWVCPYDALQFDAETGRMTKCDFCFEFLDDGKPPACVSACPGRVLDFGEISELKKKYSGSGETFPLPDAQLTGPSLLIKPHPDAGKANNRNSHIANREEV